MRYVARRMSRRSAFALLALTCLLGSCTPKEPSAPGATPPPSAAPDGDTVALTELTGKPANTDEAALAAARDARWAARRLAQPAGDSAAALFAKAEADQRAQNFKDAAQAFTAFCTHYPKDPRLAAAAERAMFNHFRLKEFTEGLFILQDTLALLQGTADAARLHRVLGNTYLALPHWGVTRGGEYKREQYGQGKSTQSFWHDRAKAIIHLEAARIELLQPTRTSTAPTTIDPLSEDERNDMLFDLVAAIAKYTPYDTTWNYWYYAWGATPDDGLASEGDGTGRRARGKHGRAYFGGYWQGALQRAQPRGLPVSPSGEILFEKRPEAYATSLPPTSKIKFLLHELGQRDKTEARAIAGRALLMQAALFRSRDGVERLRRLGGWWNNGSYPYKARAEDNSSLVSLADDEVMGLIATHIGRYQVPEDEAVPALLARVIKEAPKTQAADEAAWLLGAFHQSRRQYTKALASYHAYEATHTQGAFLRQVRAAITQIERREAIFTEMGVQPAGRRAQVSIQHRNLSTVDVLATEIDVEEILKDFKRSWKNSAAHTKYRNPVGVSNLAHRLTRNQRRGTDDFEKYRTDKTHRFSVALKQPKNHQYDTSTIDTPLQQPGLFVLEARHKNLLDKDAKPTVFSRGVLLVTGLAVVKKRAAKHWLVWVTDPVTGHPVPGAKVESFEYWTVYRDSESQTHSRSRHYVTDAQGIAKVPFRSRSAVTIVRHEGKVGFADWGLWGSSFKRSGVSNQTVSALTTDRPVYRPGDVVQLKAWVRKKKDGLYRPATATKKVEFRIFDSKGAQVQIKTMPAGQWGSAHMSLRLSEEAALGRYRVQVRADGHYTDGGSMGFNVEEYKAPEFTVKIQSAGEARLGDKVPVEIRADYLFGGGVAAGKVSYKVFREDHNSGWSTAQSWDWLYGMGYGRCYYRYAWFSWWSHHGPWSDVWYPWWGPKPEPARELVKEGQAKLDAQGVLRFELDTSSAKASFGDTDHKYSIEAEVTDLSRRVIKGTGSITVTRHPFQLGIEAKRGYVSAGQGVQLWLQAKKPDGTGLKLSGRLLVEEVRFVGDNGDTVQEQEREVLPVETEALGPILVTWKAKHTGQYKFTFIARADGGDEVRASTLSWVVGPGWTGNKYRMNGLEVITDRRTYKPGDVARLLINVDQAGASVLLGTDVESGVLLKYEILKFEGKSRAVEIPITERHVPNFFIEATTVGQGTLHQELRQLYVPPQKSAMNISVVAPKKVYAPGEETTLQVKTTDAQGNPVAADIALSVFDKAVLYIQEDIAPDIRSRFWARLRHHNLVASTNLDQKFSVYGGPINPDLSAVHGFSSLSSRFFQREVNFAYDDSGVRGSGLAGRLMARDNTSAKDAKEDRLGFAKAGEKKLKAKARGAAKRERRRSALGGLGKNKAMGMLAADGEAAASASTFAAVLDAPSAAAGKKKDVTVRKNFADTAHFTASVRTGNDGLATVEVKFPDNLTTWKIKATGLGPQTRAGQTTTEVQTTKNLLIRLQAPRFFRERDEVVLSAIVHNRHETERTIEVSLDVNSLLQLQGGKATVRVTAPPKSDKRVDWRVKVSGEGEATVRMTAVTDAGEGDAQQLTFPVLVHGMNKMVSGVGSISGDKKGTHTKSLKFRVPEARRPQDTKLTIRVSPTLSGAMLDALPYLLEYPYGCTEQTLSRFVPAVLTRKALQDAGGLKLEDLKTQRTNLNPQQLTSQGEVDRARIERKYKRYAHSPVFDTRLMNRMIRAGLKRLTQMQGQDGGWGWWGADRSSRYTTAHVVAGLTDARDADLSFEQNLLHRGEAALEGLIAQTIYHYEQHDWVSNEDAYAAWVLSRSKRKNDKLNGYLWERRVKLSAYGKLLAALAFHNLGDFKKAAVLLKNAEQILSNDDDNETSWLETRKSGWWYWYNSDIETNAMWLRALDTIADPDKRAPRVVKWLLNHRQNGWYWRSTRDTAMVVSSLAYHMKISKERRTNYDLEVLLDGKVIEEVHIDHTNLLSFNGEFVVEGAALSAGEHEITFRRIGQGAVYFNTYLEYFTLEEDVPAAGLEIKVQRQYFKLERADREVIRYGARGQPVVTKTVAYKKTRLPTGAHVDSGDLILVELMLESKNDYTFLAFEDPKPAGMEAVALKSGTTYGEAVANMELRDERVVFFLRSLSRGKLKLSYRLRAEIPGSFHAMPTRGFAMYAPELKANSDEWRISIED